MNGRAEDARGDEPREAIKRDDRLASRVSLNEPLKALRWAGGLSIVGGTVHGMLTDAHFAEWWAFGLFFMFAAMAQGLYGFAILASEVMNGAPISERWPLKARRAWYAVGIVGNSFLILMYLASRTIGVLGEVEAWDGLGIFTKLIELALVILLVVLFARAKRAPLHRGPPVHVRPEDV